MILELGIFWIAQQASAIERQRAALEKQMAAIERQKQAVRRQVKLAVAMPGSFFVISDPADLSPCPVLPIVRQQALVDSASRKTGVPPDLIAAVIQQESAFRPCSLSEKGAMGLMQLMPDTAEDLGVEDGFDPDQNVEAGATLLKGLMERYGGDLIRVLAAYNAGPGRVDRAGGVPAIPETMKYVQGILGRLQQND